MFLECPLTDGDGTNCPAVVVPVRLTGLVLLDVKAGMRDGVEATAGGGLVAGEIVLLDGLGVADGGATRLACGIPEGVVAPLGSLGGLGMTG